MKTPQVDRLPPFLQRYFWDIDPTALDVSQHPTYVMERLLEYGDPEAVRWLLQRFSQEELAAVVQRSRQLSPRSANFWALYFGVSKEDVRCLSRPFREQAEAVWPY